MEKAVDRFDEIFRKRAQLLKEELIRFWWTSEDCWSTV